MVIKISASFITHFFYTRKNEVICICSTLCHEEKSKKLIDKKI